MTARDRARRAPATGLTGLLADEARELGDLARRAVPSRRRAGILGVVLLALLALSGVAGAAEPDPGSRSALDAWGSSPAPAAPGASAASVSSAAPGASAAPAASADPLPAGALGSSPMFAGPNLFDLGLKAGLVIVLLFVTLRVLKRVQGGSSARKGDQLLDVVESRTIGPKTQLHLVAIGDRRLVVGQTPSGLVALGELDAAELPLGDAAAILEALGVPAGEPAAARTRPEPAAVRTRPEPVAVRPTMTATAAALPATTDAARRPTAGRAAPAPRPAAPSAARPAAARPSAERPVTDRLAPDRAEPARAEPRRAMDVRIAAYGRPIADLDHLDDLPVAVAAPTPRPTPIRPTPIRSATPSVDERVERAAARARAERAAAAARAERMARVDRALAAADRAAEVAERAAQVAERAALAADRAAMPATRPAATAVAPAARPTGRAPRPAVVPAPVTRPAVPARSAFRFPTLLRGTAPEPAPSRARPSAPADETLLELALRLAAQAGRDREAQVERAAASLSAPSLSAASAPAEELDMAAIMAALAAETVDERPVERTRARRLEVSA